MKRTKEEDIFSFILAPLIDVMLFILIFFMVSYARQSSFQNIALPSSDSSFKEEKKQKIIILELSQKGEFFLNGKNYTLEEISQALQGLDITQPLVLRADKTLSYQKIIDAMDIIKKSGVQKVYLATI